MHWLFHVACALGAAVSAYAVYVERRVSEDDDYVALCDFSPSASCSKVVSSSYGRTLSHYNLVPEGHWLDQTNAAYGFAFYVGMWLVAHVPVAKWNVRSRLLMLGALLSIAYSAFLAYILFFELKDFCLICVTSYVCNILLLVSVLVSNHRDKVKSL